MFHTEPNTRWIKDLGCAAALVARDHEIIKMVPKPEQPSIMLFYFVADEEMLADEKAYWDGTLTGKLQKFYSTMRSLKARIKNQ